MKGALLIRNVEIDGKSGLDLRIAAGRIAAIGRGLSSASETLDGKGGALIPGLVDHHIHLLALAAQAHSLAVDKVTGSADFARHVRAALLPRPLGAWLRVTGYHESIAGDLTRQALDELAPDHALRVQHQTGALWILNSLGLARVGAESGPDAMIERDAAGQATGRIWRGDAWLRQRLGTDMPPLAPIGQRLARLGIAAVTDTSATTDDVAAEYLADAGRSGALPQRLMLMSGLALRAPKDGAFAVGAVKILLDDHDLPDIDAFTARIASARVWDRSVAVHCVTAAQLALTLAAFEEAGSRPGDRIEHGGVIPKEAIEQIRALGLAVVTQQGFIHDRGDRYLRDVERSEQPDLYRCASLLAAGIPVAGGSDAPYATPDPWLAIRAAMERRTRAGDVLGDAERVDAASALALYHKSQTSPAMAGARLAPGAAADLCLLKAPLAEALRTPEAGLVRATIIRGALAFLDD